MDKSKMMAILSNALSMTYAEWRLIADEIEHGFQMRMNREKLEKDDANPEYILTKWGVGYYFKAE